MEHFLLELLKIGEWTIAIIFIFAIIGVYATIRWIIRLVRGTESAVESGVKNVEDRFK